VSADLSEERKVKGAAEQAAPMDDPTPDPAFAAAIAAAADRSAQARRLSAEWSAEARRLAMPTLLAGWRRAGGAAPVEERIAPPAAAHVLREILVRPGRPELLPEWIALAAQAGVAVPYEIVPDLLHTGERIRDMREITAGALGPFGRWLAGLNPAWSYAANAPPGAEDWRTATVVKRFAILRQTRRSDPAAGLALLRSTWSMDPPLECSVLLDGLTAGLGMDDEPFLESALDHEQREVRTAAAGLLATLPGSRLVGRMTERLAPLLRLREPGGEPRIDVELPATCDRGMRRDGIRPAPPLGTDEGTWWLQRMLAAVPPSIWTARWGMDPAAALDAARGGEHGPLLVRGWAEAAIHSRDADWAEALLRAEVGTDWLNAIKGLAAALPPDRLERLVLERMRDAGRRTDDFTLQLLDTARAWSPALTRAVLAAVPAPPLAPASGIGSRLGRYALHMHPATAIADAGLRERVPREGDLVDLLHLRHAMHEAFR
jgi:Family of unknown function (DUF5691)